MTSNMRVKKRICVITSQHHPNDVRIFYKEIHSLKKRYSEIWFVVKKTENAVPEEDVRFLWLNAGGGIVFRILRLVKIGFYFLKIKADVYHFHDPDLAVFLPFLRYFLTRKSKLIYDIHENYPDAISHKDYLPKVLRNVFSKVYVFLEKKSLPHIDLLILAEAGYTRYYRQHPNVAIIQNYVLNHSAMPYAEKPWDMESCLHFVYVGGVTEKRGITEALLLIKYLNTKFDCRFHIIGPIFNKGYEKRIQDFIRFNQLEEKITLYGYLDHTKAMALVQKAHIGILFLHPIRNYMETLPTKLFEYMGNGLVVMCSNFPDWVELNRRIEFGMTVDIFNIKNEITAIFDFVSNRDRLMRISKLNMENARKYFSWDTEEKKLLEAYKALTG